MKGISMEVLRQLDGAHRVERLQPSWCGKTQIACIEAARAAVVAKWNSGDLLDNI